MEISHANLADNKLISPSICKSFAELMSSTVSFTLRFWRKLNVQSSSNILLKKSSSVHSGKGFGISFGSLSL